MTYNVLGTPLFRDERTPPLLKLLEQSNADIIALQEVAPWFLSRLMAQKWVRAYHVTKPGGRLWAPGGQLILSKPKIYRASYHLLPGAQRRTVVIAELRIGKRPLAVATVHMESFLEDGPIRARQLDRVFALLKTFPHAVFLGDFNFGDGEKPETSRLEKSYVDLWRALYPKKPGFTWDMQRSEMAKKGAFNGEKSRRLDRILVRMPGYSPQSARIIGNMPVSPTRTHVFPSDHFGLLGTISLATER